MNQLMLAMAMGGGGVSPDTIKALTAQRQRNYEKLCKFIKWIATTLVYAYYWLKKHPAVVTADGKTPDTSGVGIQALMNAFWTQQDQKDFIGNMVREGSELLMEFLRPDPHEMDMWAALMQHPSPVSQIPALLGNQQASLQTLQQLLQGMQQPAAGGNGLPPPQGNLTYAQYVQQYGVAPPAAGASTAAGAGPVGRPRATY